MLAVNRDDLIGIVLIFFSVSALTSKALSVSLTVGTLIVIMACLSAFAFKYYRRKKKTESFERDVVRFYKSKKHHIDDNINELKRIRFESENGFWLRVDDDWEEIRDSYVSNIVLEDVYPSDVGEEFYDRVEEYLIRTLEELTEDLDGVSAEIEEEIEEICDLATQSIVTHLDTLKLKRRQGTITNEYNQLRDNAWIDHRNWFVKEVALEGIDPEEIVAHSYKEVFDYLTEQVDEYTDDYNDIESEYDDLGTGHEYEEFVRTAIESLGWKSIKTKGSGDQGVDIIAIKGPVKIVVQCKKWGAKVTNKAVQEIYAGKTYEDANFAIVVTNSSFTTSAIKLAESTGVILLHHDQLENINNLRRQSNQNILRLAG
jgi:restriction system protein